MEFIWLPEISKHTAAGVFAMLWLMALGQLSQGKAKQQKGRGKCKDKSRD